MSLESAINELNINIISINTTLSKMVKTHSISLDTPSSNNVNKSSSEYTTGSRTKTVNEIKTTSETNIDLDQVRKSLNEVVKSKGKETAVKLLATFHNAKTLEDIEDHEYSNVVKKAKSILEAS